MAINFRSVYYATKEKYEMNLITGSTGLDKLFSWVHILENINTMDYLHGNEIVITTGIGKDSDTWLFEYVQKVISSGATALIINTGQFIRDIPKNIIDYCSKKNFPLITVPWKIHLIDIIRDYCNRIFASEQLSYSLMGSIKNAIFHPNSPETFERQLERNNFDLHSDYTILAISSDDLDILRINSKLYGKLRLKVEVELNKFRFINCIFDYDNSFFIVINSSNSIPGFANSIDKMLKANFEEYNFNISVSSTASSIFELHRSYKQIEYVKAHMHKKSSNSVCFFEDNGINELILAVNNYQLLEDSALKTLEPILKYDQEAGTEYLDLLKLYLQENCSVKAVSEKTFSHRNTINYRIKRIKNLLGVNLDENEERFKLILAFHIMDIL
ncbi:PucR family transcriptional regulator ligand-binding domain-containing protein [Liquorilactobacillus mali]|uniref:PucR family transcriptional regulator n=1 Tax=Liquorilactobacillus mali TaxID=1618 RepID=A0A0R2FNU3_9LACO|nr:PucR family transcriptional regulator [Liquorilactobacillus mali]KRN30243.1 PucR family transcriptional regulator [Liquorilactobacillus mali]MDN7146059.1 PucR family transcriptional regulator ligand-binding domain-containing protein [Liquorilactobacillus mali]